MAEIAIQSQSRQPNANRGRRINRPRGKGGPNAAGTPRGESNKLPRAGGGQAAAKVDPIESAFVSSQGAEAEEADESRICWICAEPVKYYAVSECNHRTCHVCALRLRALYKKLDCTFCKEPQPTVIFTVSGDALFSSYSPSDISFKDAKLSIFFETQEMMEDTLILLRFNCPDTSCDYVATGWNDLKLHARGVHGKLMCDICLRQKKVFSHEHALYAPSQLAVHLPSIPHRPQKAVPKEQIEGGIHPLCEFCRDCFFGDDELYAHMRHTHEECFICKRNDVRDQYFKNYEALEKHFDHAHHPCPNPTCQARKFVVFNTLLDLQAHSVEEHGADMSSRDKKDARRIITGFEFQEVGGGRRRGPREREPPPGPSTAPPPVRSSNNSRRNRFGAHLTGEGEGGDSSGNDSPAPSRRQSPSPLPADMDPITAERYTALYARVKAVAPHPTNAVAAVKLSLRSYNASESGARDLISTIWNILDRDLDNTASIVNLIVDLLDDEDKKSSLLSAWNGFKIEQRRQFPDLVPASIGSDYAGITGGRVLNARTSSALRGTRQSSRAVWDRVAQAATSGVSPAPAPRLPRFPPLQPAAPVPTSGFRQPTRNTAWSASAAGASTPPAPQPVTPPSTSRTRAPPPALSSKAFPTLPSASASRLKPVTGGNASLQKILGSSAPATSAWSPSGGATTPPTGPPEADGSAQEPVVTGGGGKKKGKAKQKQTLFTLGSFPT